MDKENKLLSADARKPVFSSSYDYVHHKLGTIQLMEHNNIYIDKILNTIAKDVYKSVLFWRTKDKNIVTDFDESEMSNDWKNKFVEYFKHLVTYRSDGLFSSFEKDNYLQIYSLKEKPAYIVFESEYSRTGKQNNGWDISHMFLDKEEHTFNNWLVHICYSDKEMLNIIDNIRTVHRNECDCYTLFYKTYRLTEYNEYQVINRQNLRTEDIFMEY